MVSGLARKHIGGIMVSGLARNILVVQWLVVWLETYWWYHG